MIRLIKRKLYLVKSRFLSRATVVEGRLKGTENHFRCLFVGKSNYIKYLVARMYEEPPVVLREWRIWVPALRKLILTKEKAFDLCVAVLPKACESTLQGLYDFKCTEFIRQIIDTSGSWDSVRNRFSKTNYQITKRFVEKSGLGYRISSDLQEFDHFYHRMFVPHITKRFRDLSEIDAYDDMKETFRKGFLLFVTKGGEAVTGALFTEEDGILRYSRAGVLDGDEAHIEGGAQTALYYFQLKYANEHNLRAVDTMMSMSFLNDGVYMHKRAWGAAVFPNDESPTRVYYFIANPSEKMARFFEKNPIIAYTDQGLKGVFGSSGTTDISAEDINDVVRQYRANGIHGFTVMTRTGALSLA